MTQAEMEQMLQALGQVAVEQQAITRQQQIFNERVTVAIERLEMTIQAIKDLLERG